MLLPDSRLNALLKTIETAFKQETHPLATILRSELGEFPAGSQKDFNWEDLRPKATRTADLPGLCWWFLNQLFPGNSPYKSPLERLQEEYRKELLNLMEAGEQERCLRTSFLLNYFVLLEQRGIQQIDSQKFVTQLPIEQYIRKITSKANVPINFMAGLTPMGLTLVRLYDLLPAKSNTAMAICDWLSDLTALIRQYLMPVRMSEQLFSFFPIAINQADESCEISQHLNWACGDLNQVFLFRAVGSLLNDTSLLKLAERVAEFTTLRQQQYATLVSDISVGGGTTGLVLMYDQLYRQTGQSTYLNAYSYWLERTAEQTNALTNLVSSNFLNGALGTYLALQAVGKPDDMLASLLFVM